MPKLTPMLASSAKFEEVKLPALMSTKIDGFRNMIWGNVALTRSLKPQPNFFVRSYLSREELNGLDGELTVGSPDDPNVFQNSTSELRSHDGSPDFTFWVFDHRMDVEDKRPFTERLAMAREIVTSINDHRVRILEHKLITTRDEQAEFEAWCVEREFEGSMARSLDGPYKNGRSTMREGFLVKRKTFEHGEAVITGHFELMRNLNEAYINETGAQKRSTNAENMVPGDMLGGFTCLEMLQDGTVTNTSFSLGGGFTESQRIMFWQMLKEDPNAFQGEIVRFKHFPYGRKDKPRQPVFDGFRAKEDMGGAF